MELDHECLHKVLIALYIGLQLSQGNEKDGYVFVDFDILELRSLLVANYKS